MKPSNKISNEVLRRLGGRKKQTKASRRFWAESLGGKLRCPECGGIVTEHWEKDSIIFYECHKCSWTKEVDLEGSSDKLL